MENEDSHSFYTQILSLSTANCLQSASCLISLPHCASSNLDWLSLWLLRKNGPYSSEYLKSSKWEPGSLALLLTTCTHSPILSPQKKTAFTETCLSAPSQGCMRNSCGSSRQRTTLMETAPSRTSWSPTKLRSLDVDFRYDLQSEPENAWLVWQKHSTLGPGLPYRELPERPIDDTI